MTNTLTEKAQAFLAQRPTLVGTVLGNRFYEHPRLGDEAPLVVITADGRKRCSGFYDLPSAAELPNRL